MTKRADAEALIERVRTLRLAGQTAEADELRSDAEAAVKACAPKDRKAMSAALEDAYAAGQLEIKSHHDVAGVDDLISQGVGQVRDAVEAGIQTADKARVIATTLLDARLKMPNKAGLPDILGSSKFTKNIAHDMFTEARKGVADDDVDRVATHNSLAKAVRNRMSDVVVAYMRGLDKDPATFPAMEAARARFPKLTPTDAVYALYEAEGFKIPRKGRTELAREDARRKAKALEALKKGQASPEDLESDSDDLASDMEALERMERSFTRLTTRARDLPQEDRAALKAKINETIVALSAQAASL